MQRLTHNQKRLTVRRRPHVAFVYLLVLLQTLAPLPVSAKPATMGEITSLTSFKALMLVIANLNRAMESAAQNPQDDWRRQDAARAYSALPPAIIGLAQDFKAGKLGNEDLPLVQAMLGGFVNKNAADNFKQFMKSPSKNLIPQVSPQLAGILPKTAAPSAPNGPAVATAKAPAAPNSSTGAGQEAGAVNPQILSLADPAVMGTSGSGGTPGAASAGKDQSQAISYDESAAKQKAGSASSNVAPPATDGSGLSGSKVAALKSEFGGGTSASAGANDSSSTGNASAASASASRGSYGPATVGDAIKELRQVEVGVATAGAATAPVAAKEDPDKAQFFSKIKVGGQDDEADDQEVGGSRHAKSKAAKTMNRRPAGSKRGELAPKYFNVRPLVRFAESLLIEEAHAEGSDGGGKEGGSAADILYGLAALLAAGAPIAVASIQAGADKYIAKTNADAQIQMTQITSDTSKYLADQQKNIALQQADIAQAVNKSNNDYVSQRLNMQLSELANARHEAEQAEQQKLAIEQQYNNQRIALAQQQAAQNVKLAQQTLNAQLTQLGLSSGAANSLNGGNRLTTSTAFGVPSAGAGVGTSLGASVGGLGGGPQNSGLVDGRGGSSIGSAASTASRATASNSPNAMSFNGDRGGVTAYNLGNAGGVAPQSTSSGGASSGAPASGSVGAAVAAMGGNAPGGGAGFAVGGNRGAVVGGGGDSAGSAGSAGEGPGSSSFLMDLKSAGDTSGISAPSPVQEIVAGDLSKGNEALLASVHQPGSEGTSHVLHPRGAAVGGADFSQVRTLADSRNRGGKRGAGRSRLSSGRGRSGAYRLDESRILNYLRPRGQARLVNGSTPEDRARIVVTPKTPDASDLGLFTRGVVKETSPENDFVRFREAALAATRNRGATSADRSPASTGRGDGFATGSGHKRGAVEAD